MKRTFAEHLDPNVGPKRILACSGGGIRGALTLGYLEQIETELRAKYDDPKLVLSDYFDLIGGTSTGSIIAAGLSIGMSVKDLVDLYMDLGGKIFGEKRTWWNPLETWKFLKAAYDYSALEKSLRGVFGDITLESDKIKTGLCIVCKRADTNSTWPIINHPKGQFFDSDIGKNKDIPLWQAVRASSAAPTYFAPQMINVGAGQRAAFVDGGVSMANNPALSLLMVATLKGFPFHWKLGAENIEVVSVGTGYTVFAKRAEEIDQAWMGTWATNVPNMLMQDANWQNQIVMQWLSESPTAKEIDMEMGTLQGDVIGGSPQIKYLRYDFPITETDLNGLGIGNFDEEAVESIADMANAENRQLLYKIGAAAGKKEVEASHFA